MARDPMLPLRLKMMEQGYTQKQLCGEIGCCEGYFVERIMCRRDWKLGDVYKICDTLNIPMEQIVDYFPRRWKA